jgi:hypothetical protein
MIVTTDVNPWYKWKENTILALFLPESCKNRDKIGFIILNKIKNGKVRIYNFIRCRCNKVD